VWKALNHPNILPLLGVEMTETWFAMVSEWMTDGNINQFVAKHWDANRFALVGFSFKPLSPLIFIDDYVISKLGDIAKGLIYMHDQGMVHGDLKGVRL
jgi:serine/threonine protein kinase